MLRIKESEWQRFCDNAEKLGFYLYTNGTYCLPVDDWLDIIEIYEIDKKKMKIYTSDIDYIEITEKEIYIETDFNKKNIVLDKLYDLIEQGYVEKVEE